MRRTDAFMPLSERWQYRAVVLLVDEVFDLLAGQRLGQFLDRVGVSVVGTGYQIVHVRRVGTFQNQRILFRAQLGFQRVVGVDQVQVDLVQSARQQRRLQFAEFQFFRVGGDVFRRRQGVSRVFQSDQTILLQQQQSTTGVAAFVRDGNGGAFRQLVDGLPLLGVAAERVDVHANARYQSRALAFVEAVQIRLGLEVVGVQTFLVQLHVRLHVVGEDLDLQVHTFLGQLRLDQLEDFGVWNRSRADHEFFGGLGRADGKGSRQCGEQQSLFHAMSLGKIRSPCGQLCIDMPRVRPLAGWRLKRTLPTFFMPRQYFFVTQLCFLVLRKHFASSGPVARRLDPLFQTEADLE